VILEGWMLGFSPVDHTPDPFLDEINDLLPHYKKWTKFLHGLFHMVARDLNHIISWRVEAEENMKAQGKDGMSTEQARAYIEKFIPAYETYVPQMLKHPPGVSQLRVIELGANRLINTP